MATKVFLQLPNFSNIIKFISIDKLLFLSELPFSYVFSFKITNSIFKNKFFLKKNLFLKIELVIYFLNVFINSYNFKINLRLIKVFLRKPTYNYKLGFFCIYKMKLKILINLLRG